jgi:hypothetical protein
MILHVQQWNEWIWECNSCTILGEGYLQRKDSKTRKKPWFLHRERSDPSRKKKLTVDPQRQDGQYHDINDHGDAIIRDYICREMTKESDKLLALSGLARYFGVLTQDEYFAGLWKNTILPGLLWRRPTREIWSRPA